MISSFRRDVDKIFVLLGYYAASCGNCLPTFRDNVSVPSSPVKSPVRKERKPATYNVDSYALFITPLCMSNLLKCTVDMKPALEDGATRAETCRVTSEYNFVIMKFDVDVFT
jgi:hypothetical protein